MLKLINKVQHYAWGSTTALTVLYGIPNPGNKPMAELWMGAHPNGSSMINDSRGYSRSLQEIIAEDTVKSLGEAVARRFGELPFLFKVLCAGQPLSVQVHPSREAAQAGFAREDIAGIPRNAATRNYKDANHKPELVYALTPFIALNGFRDFTEITNLLQPLADAHPAIVDFLAQPQADTLRQLFTALLAMEGDEKAHALARLKQRMADTQGEPWDQLRNIATYYPDDCGLFSPLLLNLIKLMPGEAMFLFAETPHAYLEGIGLEIMANSDNVLRAGLTGKYIDIPELIANVAFKEKLAAQWLTAPVSDGQTAHFPVPVDDFAFSVYTLEVRGTVLPAGNPAILFCIEGEASLSDGEQTIQLVAGESAFIDASESAVIISGKGKLARAYAGVTAE
ncbi:mannose-6-phosphate isomerase [Klebsiella sp. BIGb0407]|uniref:mannose-6-phosphate isomerase n=1 Tax=Klebsiella sp. BIGb0407 TaxID=2940603 RepID=UPI00216A433D|nr:mannose-6-phosphate isomerase [Klebsiella sp. BIGb0407]MCS3430615.1 mannose-6-phosphate isomerase [Klebsiella sp. BIGb0407]